MWYSDLVTLQVSRSQDAGRGGPWPPRSARRPSPAAVTRVPWSTWPSHSSVPTATSSSPPVKVTTTAVRGAVCLWHSADVCVTVCGNVYVRVCTWVSVCIYTYVGGKVGVMYMCMCTCVCVYECVCVCTVYVCVAPVCTYALSACMFVCVCITFSCYVYSMCVF